MVRVQYRLYFLSAGGRIEVGQDFAAASDEMALVVADALCESCADVCDKFELWQGIRRVEKLPVRRDPAMVAAAEREILKTARALRESGGTLAKSERLAAALERLERDVAARG